MNQGGGADNQAGAPRREGVRQAGVCHIVAAGECYQIDLHPAEGDMVIAADAGYRLCRAAGVTPDLYIGDYDSLTPDELAGSGVERVELSWEKDDTDTIAAMRVGLERGYRRFAVHAALGGDVGHELANMQALLFLRGNGADGVLLGERQRVLTVVPSDGERVVETAPDMRVSVFAFGGTARGVCERGLHWELEDAELSPEFPLGVSNHAVGREARISVREGTLIVVVG